MKPSDGMVAFLGGCDMDELRTRWGAAEQAADLAAQCLEHMRKAPPVLMGGTLSFEDWDRLILDGWKSIIGSVLEPLIVENERLRVESERPRYRDEGSPTEGDCQSPPAAKIREQIEESRRIFEASKARLEKHKNDQARMEVRDELEISIRPAQPSPGRSVPPIARTPISPDATCSSTAPPPPRAGEVPTRSLTVQGYPTYDGLVMFCLEPVMREGEQPCHKPAVLEIAIDGGETAEKIYVCEGHRHAKLDALARVGYVVTSPSVLALIRKKT
jgi:hypothetical protein